MNTVIINAPKAKPLMFADIPPGPFIFNGVAYTKLSKPIGDWNCVEHSCGVLLYLVGVSIVTLPDAPPPQDDTVAYHDLKAGEMFVIVSEGGCTYMKGDELDGDSDCYAVQLANGKLFGYPNYIRVRRVHSVTITREESK